MVPERNDSQTVHKQITAPMLHTRQLAKILSTKKIYPPRESRVSVTLYNVRELQPAFSSCALLFFDFRFLEVNLVSGIVFIILIVRVELVSSSVAQEVVGGFRENLVSNNHTKLTNIVSV